MSKLTVKDQFDRVKENTVKVNELLKSKAPKEEIDLILEEIKVDFEKVLEFVEYHLITTRGQVLFAQLIGELGGLTINFNIRGLVGLQIKRNDMELHLNPLFLEDKDFQELITEIVAEITRAMYDHPVSFKKNSDKPNFKINFFFEGSDITATEVIISDYMRNYDEGKRTGLKIPEDMMTKSKAERDYGASAAGKQTVDYYYKFLEKYKKEDPESPFEQPPGSGQDDQEDEEQDNNKPMPSQAGQQEDDQNGDQNQNQDNESQAATPQNQSGEPARNWGDTEPQEYEAAMSQKLKDAIDTMTDKQRGDIPGNIMQHIKDYIKPPVITWKDILKRYVGGYPAGVRKTPFRLNRTQPFNPLLKGKTKNKHIELVVVIDTSGSMSSIEIEYALSEMEHILDSYETRITVIECDMRIGRVYEVTKPKDIKPEVTGRGGTLFSPAINYINAHKQLHGSLMIYFTDGGGEYELEERPLTRRNLWILTGSDYEKMSLKETYGEVKRLSDDPDYQKQIQQQRGW